MPAFRRATTPSSRLLRFGSRGRGIVTQKSTSVDPVKLTVARSMDAYGKLNSGGITPTTVSGRAPSVIGRPTMPVSPPKCRCQKR